MKHLCPRDFRRGEMEENMSDYELIKNQIINSMKKVDQQYYMPLVAESEETSHTIKRERNFCYELYHQMRSNTELMCLIEDYAFSCEFDKRGHKLFKHGLIPDFILHRAGKMTLENKDNLLVMEIKVVLNSHTFDGIAKDFNSLSLMLSNYKYQYGIFILINHSLEKLQMNIENICKSKEYIKITNKQKKKFSSIDVICLESQTSEENIITLDKLIKGIDHE